MEAGTHPGATPSRACRRCHRLKALTPRNFSPAPRGRPGFRNTCKPCATEEETGRQRLRKERGYRICIKCKREKPVESFDLYLRDGEHQRRKECKRCMGSILPVDVESEMLQKKHLPKLVRWSVSLQILLGRRNLTMAQLLALKPDERREFELRWSELMREMASDVGELVVIIDPLMQGREQEPHEGAALVRMGRSRTGPARLSRAAA